MDCDCWYAGRPTPKMIKKLSRETSTDVKKQPHRMKGNGERGREGERERGLRPLNRRFEPAT